MCSQNEMGPGRLCPDSPPSPRIVFLITFTLAADFTVYLGGRGRTEEGYDHFVPTPV